MRRENSSDALVRKLSRSSVEQLEVCEAQRWQPRTAIARAS